MTRILDVEKEEARKAAQIKASEKYPVSPSSSSHPSIGPCTSHRHPDTHPPASFCYQHFIELMEKAEKNVDAITSVVASSGVLDYLQERPEWRWSKVTCALHLTSVCSIFLCSVLFSSLALTISLHQKTSATEALLRCFLRACCSVVSSFLAVLAPVFFFAFPEFPAISCPP